MIRRPLVIGCACVSLLAGGHVIAQTKATRLRGVVLSEATREPIAGASVSASGDAARQSEVTDDQGFFRIMIEGVAPGDLVRIRVTKSGYAVYDRQVVSTEEKPLEILLRNNAQPTVQQPSQPTDPVIARFAKQIDDPNVQVRLNALEFLAGRASTNSAAMSAVIAAALNSDWRVRRDAVGHIGRLRPKSKEAVTNLIIGLHDVEGYVRGASTAALAAFPKDKDAIAALLERLGAPPSINVGAMNSLAAMQVEDPRVAEALFYEVTLGNTDAIGALLKKAPLSKEMVTRLMAELAKALDTNKTLRQQRILGLLLKGGGTTAREALHQYLATTDAYHQSRLALCWLELDRAVKSEILQTVPVENLNAEFKKALDRAQAETVHLAEMRDGRYITDEFSSDLPHSCPYAVMLRSAMGVLVLELPSQTEDALKVFAYALLGDHGQECGDYAVIAMRWIRPTDAKRLIPVLAPNLECRPSAQDIDKGLVADTLGEVGDETTITLLQRIAEEVTVVCGDDLREKNLERIFARIRARQ